MKISRREMIIGVATLFTVLFGVTYGLGGSKIEEQRKMAEDKTRLLRQIKLHQRILEEKESWRGRLEELQAQLPVYDQRVSVNGEILKSIKRVADQHKLDLTKSRTDPEKAIGNLFELSVVCEWEGELDALVHFLYAVNEQGLRFDIRELTIRPDAKRAGIIRGSIIIDCAYRRSTAEES